MLSIYRVSVLVTLALLCVSVAGEWSTTPAVSGIGGRVFKSQKIEEQVALLSTNESVYSTSELDESQLDLAESIEDSAAELLEMDGEDEIAPTLVETEMLPRESSSSRKKSTKKAPRKTPPRKKAPPRKRAPPRKKAPTRRPAPKKVAPRRKSSVNTSGPHLSALNKRLEQSRKKYAPKQKLPKAPTKKSVGGGKKAGKKAPTNKNKKAPKNAFGAPLGKIPKRAGKKTSAPKKAGAPKKTAPKKSGKAAGGKKTASPKKGGAPKKAASPKKGASPKKAASPKKGAAAGKKASGKVAPAGKKAAGEKAAGGKVAKGKLVGAKTATGDAKGKLVNGLKSATGKDAKAPAAKGGKKAAAPGKLAGVKGVKVAGKATSKDAKAITDKSKKGSKVPSGPAAKAIDAHNAAAGATQLDSKGKAVPVDGKKSPAAKGKIAAGAKTAAPLKIDSKKTAAAAKGKVAPAIDPKTGKMSKEAAAARGKSIDDAVAGKVKTNLDELKGTVKDAKITIDASKDLVTPRKYEKERTFTNKSKEQQATEKAAADKQAAIDAKKPPPTLKDKAKSGIMDYAKGLKDAGVNQIKKALTVEKKVSFEKEATLKTYGNLDTKKANEAAAGVKLLSAKVSGEAGASLGPDGAKAYAKGGVEVTALDASARTKEYSTKALGGLTAQASANVVAKASASGEIQARADKTGVGLKAGVKAEAVAEASISGTVGSKKLGVQATTKLSAYAGAGVHADVALDYDAKTSKLTIGGGVGASLGAGLGVSEQIVVDPKVLGKAALQTFGVDYDKLSPAQKRRIAGLGNAALKGTVKTIQTTAKVVDKAARASGLTSMVNNGVKDVAAVARVSKVAVNEYSPAAQKAGQHISNGLNQVSKDIKSTDLYKVSAAGAKELGRDIKQGAKVVSDVTKQTIKNVKNTDTYKATAAVAKEVGSDLKQGAKVVGKVAKEQYQATVKELGREVKVVGDVTKKSINAVKNSDTYKGTVKVVKEVGQDIKKGAQVVSNVAKQEIKQGVQVVKAGAAVVAEKTGQAIDAVQSTKAYKATAAAAKEVGGAIKSTDAYKKTADVAKEVGSEIKQGAKVVGRELKEGAQAAGQALKEGGTAVVHTLDRAAEGMAAMHARADAYMDATRTSMENAATSAIKGTGEYASAAVDTVAEGVSDAYEGAKDLGKSAGSAISSAWSWASGNFIQQGTQVFTLNVYSPAFLELEKMWNEEAYTRARARSFISLLGPSRPSMATPGQRLLKGYFQHRMDEQMDQLLDTEHQLEQLSHFRHATLVQLNDEYLHHAHNANFHALIQVDAGVAAKVTLPHIASSLDLHASMDTVQMELAEEVDSIEAFVEVGTHASVQQKQEVQMEWVA